MNTISLSARASCTRLLMLLFWKENLGKKTLYSGIELICKFPKLWLIVTKALFLIVSYCSVCLESLQKVLKEKSDAYK